MGAGGSIRRSPAQMQAELERLRSKEMDLLEEHDKQLKAEELKHEAMVTKLKAEKFELAEDLREATEKLNVQTDKWKKEQTKALSLMFSDLPLHLLQVENQKLVNQYQFKSTMTTTFPMVTVSQCDIVGFSLLSAKLPPEKVVLVIDQLHTLIDEAFIDSDIFIMERSSDGCIAVSGLKNFENEKQRQLKTPSSMTDSSYGSEININQNLIEKKPLELLKQSPAQYAEVLATAALKLLSTCTKISVPLPDNHTLQLRIALHSGPCSAGVIGLQTASGVARVPRYKLFGPTIRYLKTLCSSSLALQVRVSKECRDLLMNVGGYSFERCPDFTVVSNRKPLESYWLVAKDQLPLVLPSLDDAMSLRDYDVFTEC